MPKYKVYRKDDPDDHVIIEADGYLPMSIKGEAIETSDKFSWGDYLELRVSRHREVD